MDIGRVDLRLPLLSGTVLILVLVVIAIQFKDTDPDLEGRVKSLVKKEELLSRMQVNLLKSVDIEKAAVMATTDELSRSLADESLRSADAVERDHLELNRLGANDHTDREVRLLREFDTCWAELRKIDKTILDFAVENSNIKASALSFTRGRQSLDRLKQALMEITRKSASKGEYTQVLRLTYDAVTAAFEIHNLQAPHIAAASDENMDLIDKAIAQLEETISSALKELQRFAPQEAQPYLNEAVSAYGEFRGVTEAVQQLSRRNTNIKSFELSLGRKRIISAQCDEILGSLQADIRSRRFEATR
jgi:hypothetical protein